MKKYSKAWCKRCVWATRLNETKILCPFPECIIRVLVVAKTAHQDDGAPNAEQEAAPASGEATAEQEGVTL
jgi:hypothetical protein